MGEWVSVEALTMTIGCPLGSSMDVACSGKSGKR